MGAGSRPGLEPRPRPGCRAFLLFPLPLPAASPSPAPLLPHPHPGPLGLCLWKTRTLEPCPLHAGLPQPLEALPSLLSRSRFSLGCFSQGFKPSPFVPLLPCLPFLVPLFPPALSFLPCCPPTLSSPLLSSRLPTPLLPAFREWKALQLEPDPSLLPRPISLCAGQAPPGHRPGEW